MTKPVKNEAQIIDLSECECRYCRHIFSAAGAVNFDATAQTVNCPSCNKLLVLAESFMWNLDDPDIFILNTKLN